MSFEKKLNKLEKIVEKLDSSEIGLDELVKEYEEGMKLVSELKSHLNNAEQKIIDISRSTSIKEENE